MARNGLGGLAAGVLGVTGDQLLELGFVCLTAVQRLASSMAVGRQDLLQSNLSQVATALEAAILVQNVGDTTGHAGREVAARHAENDYRAASHVFAAVVAHAFDNRRTAGIADAETLAADPGKEGLTIGRTVHDGVADDDVLLRITAEISMRLDDDATARQALADVVVTFAGQFQRHTTWPGRHRKPGRPCRSA